MFLNEITRLYGEFKEDEHVRIVDNADFGFRRIIVERPLRLNFVVDKERISRLEQTSAFTKLARTRKRKDAKAAEKEIRKATNSRRRSSRPWMTSPVEES